jgi:demethylmenaquinone methyltransferase/2-methoxy-6-polyprenyl-1,4-benzoquinol methylase
MPPLDKSAKVVSSMFARIAGRYDLANHVLSGNLDRAWRRRAADSLNGTARTVLDLATGTGDLAAALRAPGRRVFGADFCLDMLAVARAKTRAEGRWSGADALALPFPDGSFDAVTIGFGLRNFDDLEAGLREIRRVLTPGGRLVILEFSRPRGIVGGCYRLYCRRVLPAIGGLLSGEAQAYRYLERSVGEWPGVEALSERLRGAGFTAVSGRAMTFGIVALHQATRR